MSSSSADDAPTRRSQRHRTPNKKYFSSDLSSGSDRSRTSKDSIVEDCDLSVLCLDSPDKENVAKASELFDEAGDVEGGNIYTFKTPKKRNAMSLMAAAAGSPKTLTSNQVKTPGTGRRSNVAREPQMGKTPQHIRAQIKRRLTRIVESSSDYSESESTTDSDAELSTTESEVEEPKTPKRRAVRKAPPSITAPITPSVSTRRRNLRAKAEPQYCLKSDDYFSSHSAKGKSLTSDHTLDRLKTPRLPHAEMLKLLSAVELPEAHETAIKELQNEYKTFFRKWLFILNEGFNLLLYGLGSKRNLMSEFHQEMLQNHHVLVVNGFFPSLTIKDILSSIICDILELDSMPTCPHEAVQLIEGEMKDLEGSHLVLIVHNLDGAMLRNGKAQSVLSQLAKIPSVHLIASIDHINTALLWDHSKLSNYNFTWWDVTSMLPYTEETAFENSLMIQNSGALALSSLKSVFQSLTTNAKGVFMLIVKKQLQSRGNSNYPGMQFKDLYSSSREAFLVSSDLALRAQLTELLDHKVVKMRQGIDGGEYLNIPIEGSLLQQFQQENQI